MVCTFYIDQRDRAPRGSTAGQSLVPRLDTRSLATQTLLAQVTSHSWIALLLTRTAWKGLANWKHLWARETMMASHLGYVEHFLEPSALCWACVTTLSDIMPINRDLVLPHNGYYQMCPQYILQHPSGLRNLHDLVLLLPLNFTHEGAWSVIAVVVGPTVYWILQSCTTGHPFTGLWHGVDGSGIQPSNLPVNIELHIAFICIGLPVKSKPASLKVWASQECHVP